MLVGYTNYMRVLVLEVLRLLPAPVVITGTPAKVSGVPATHW